MASTKWFVLTEPRLLQIPNLCRQLQEKCELVSLETFLLNPAQYETKIEAILGVNGAPLFTQHLQSDHFLDRFPNLRVLFSIGAGIDHLLFPELWKKGIRVGTTGTINAVCTAELGFLLMLASARKLKQALAVMTDGTDNYQAFRQSNGGTTLEGATLGIIGMGTIGYKFAARAAAFEMNVLYHNRSRRSKDEEEKVKATYCETLDKLLVQSDFVILCVPLTKYTKYLIGAKELKLMKSTAVLINISRGDVVDQDALVKALQDNIIHGAALDVTTPEPLPPDHPLLHMPNVIVTPHYAGGTKEVVQVVVPITVENVLAGLEGKAMKNEMKQPKNML